MKKVAEMFGVFGIILYLCIVNKSSDNSGIGVARM